MVTRYDPSVIQGFADGLYAQAKLIAALYGIAGAFIGGGAGFFLGLLVMKDVAAFIALFLAGFFAILGVLGGIARGAALRLQAQTALCQLQIQANTRRY